MHWGALALAITTSMVGRGDIASGCRGAGAPSFVTQLFDIRTIIGFGLYGGSAILYIIALRKIPMSVALPSTAVSYVVAALIGHYVFAEALGASQNGRASAMILFGRPDVDGWLTGFGPPLSGFPSGCLLRRNGLRAPPLDHTGRQHERPPGTRQSHIEP